MKKIVYILLSGILLFGTSCENFLDVEPPLNVTDADVWSDAARIETTLLGLYATVKNTAAGGADGFALLGGIGLAAMDARGDDFFNGTSNALLLMDASNFMVDDQEGYNDRFWRFAYLAINRANIFLANLERPEAQDALGTERVAQFRAEAQFIRALCYFFLVNVYAPPYVINPNAPAIPLRLQPETGEPNNHLARSTVAQIYAQILSDLSDANINALPVRGATPTEATVTRATQAAARMLRMRTYMGQRNWTAAIAQGRAITNSGIYQLAADVADTFSAPFFNQETILSFPMALNNRPNTQLGVIDFFNPVNAAGARLADVLLLNMTDGILSKPNYSLPFDARIQAFVSETTPQRLLKFRDPARLEWTHLFRYAETLLGLAESYAALGGDANEAAARALLTQVRRRSIPNVSPNYDPLDIAALSDEALRTAISNERRLELLGEGVRGIDITRRGERFVRGAINIGPGDPGYLWPIPANEGLFNNLIGE